MKNMSFIDTIKITEDNYMEVRISYDTKISSNQFSIVNNNEIHLINCTKDRYEDGCLLYYIDNLVPLKEIIATDTFDFISLKELILKITNTLINIIDKNLLISNAMLNLDYIFIDKYTKDIKMAYIPVETNASRNQQIILVQDLLKEICNNVKAINANEMISFILNKANSNNLDIVKFKRELTVLKNKGVSSRTINAAMRSYISTVLCLMIFCLVVPVVGNFLKVSLITKYIDLPTTFAFAVMFGMGALAALSICLLMNGETNKNNKSFVQHPNFETNNKFKSIPNKAICSSDEITPSEEISISNLSSFTLSNQQNQGKLEKESLGAKEYNPRSFFSSMEAKEINKTTAIDIKDDKKNSNSEIESNMNISSVDTSSRGTQLLFHKHEMQSAYIIKEGNTSLVDKIYINNHNFNIGRSKDISNFVINEKVISKQHAVIELIDNEYFITDKNSSNCTFLDDIKLTPNRRYKLANEDRITFGNQNYIFFNK